MSTIGIARVRSTGSHAWRMLAIGLLFGAAVVGAIALLPVARDLATPGTVIGSDTSFGYVAVFPTATTSADIEHWRTQVLRVHRVACVGDRACVARSLRLSGLGKQQQDVLAFDLVLDTPPDERRAIVDTAMTLNPQVRLVEHSSARAAVE